ncbi:MAG: hypothetical protein WBO44_08360, partial [Saprospiraceae bacterium]
MILEWIKNIINFKKGLVIWQINLSIMVYRIQKFLISIFCLLYTLCYSQNWQIQNTSYDLNSIFLLDNNKGWIVGRSGIIQHYDGNKWVFQNSNSTNDLASVWAIDENNAWAVGKSGTILKYNGSNWSIENSGTTSDLLGVWGLNKDNVWAVGRSGTILKY